MLKQSWKIRHPLLQRKEQGFASHIGLVLDSLYVFPSLWNFSELLQLF